MRRVLVVCVLTATVAACLFPSLDALTGSDAATDAADASLDVANDLNVADVLDASAEASTAFSCAQVDAKLCDDFDDTDAQTFSRWSSSSIFNGKIARIEGGTSPPFDVRFDLYKWNDAGTLSPSAILRRNFVDAITTSAKLSFDIFVDQYGSVPNDYFETADLNFNASAAGTNLVFGGNHAALEETIPTDAGFSYPQHQLVQILQPGQWTHVDITWTFAPNDITVDLRFDGQPVLAPLTLDPRQTWGVPALSMGGLYVNLGSDHAAFEIDNVVFDFQ